MLPAQQLHVLLAMALCGALLGSAYDAMRGLLRICRAGAGASAAADVLFGGVCAAAVTALALALRADAGRWYVFAGTAIGAGVYRASLGAGLRAVCRLMQKKRALRR